MKKLQNYLIQLQDIALSEKNYELAEALDIISAFVENNKEKILPVNNEGYYVGKRVFSTQKEWGPEGVFFFEEYGENYLLVEEVNFTSKQECIERMSKSPEQGIWITKELLEQLRIREAELAPRVKETLGFKISQSYYYSEAGDLCAPEKENNQYKTLIVVPVDEDGKLI